MLEIKHLHHWKLHFLFLLKEEYNRLNKKFIVYLYFESDSIDFKNHAGNDFSLRPGSDLIDGGITFHSDGNAANERGRRHESGWHAAGVIR